MTQVLEYITQNYTLFLFGAIIILLAVIGYYAEKTNFGQGKVDKIKEQKNPDSEKDLKNTRLMNVVNSSEINSQNNIVSDVRNNTENLVEEQNNTISNVNYNENLINDKTINVQTNSMGNTQNVNESIEGKKETENPIIDAIHKELNLVSNDVIFNEEEIKKKEIKNKKREEAFNKFSDEFDALLPKREIISDDLLSEIEDLELGKTQKFNLKDLKRFDNIKLPRISDTVTEDQDIWKF
jgi:hypothetical protein